MRLLAILLSCLLLSACAQQNDDDLSAYLDEVLARKGGKIPPLPEIKEYDKYSYHANELTDPFIPWSTQSLATEKTVATTNGISPILDRKKESLEQYPIDGLKMIGSLNYDGAQWAIIKAPDGLVYRVKRGNHLGQNHGKIKTVEEKKLVLVEIIPDGLGGWQERQASMAID